MKYTLLTAICAALLALCCTNTAPPAQNPAPAHELVPDSHFCKQIAVRDGKSRAVGVRANYWQNGQTLKIKLIGGSTAQRRWFTDAVLEWQKTVNLKTSYVTTGNADIRCAFATGDGSWSYIGTDAKGIPQSEPTINIGWGGSDVCLHEIGHALGMAHEQASPKSNICWNREAVYKSLTGPPNNWTRAMVDFNVFATMDESEADATAFDPLSIMQYSIPSSWLCQPSLGIPGGKSLSQLDKELMGRVYQKPAPPTVTVVTISAAQRDSILLWLGAAK